MPITALSATSRDLTVGQLWQLAVLVLDADLALVDAEPALVVTLPDGSTAPVVPAVWSPGDGVYSFDFPVTVPGRHLAAVTAGDYGTETFVMVATAPTPSSGMPDVDQVDAYLRSGSGDHSWTDDDLAGALAAEQDAQRRVCRVPAAYPADLREALLRRVQRNLALRTNPLAMTRGDAEAGDPSAPLPGSDPEVRRLERPWRKLPIG